MYKPESQYNFYKRISLFLKDLSVESMCSILKFGLPKRMGTIFSLRKNSFLDIERPIFFLSTGRCGTNWFQALLSHDKNLKTEHEAVPNLAFQNKFAFNLFYKAKQGEIEYNTAVSAVSEIFLAGRETYLRYCYKTKKRFAETNHYLTFFAPAIAELLPNAIFVHVYRHPGDFVRSAVRRGWFTEKNISSQAFIRPLSFMPEYEKWEQLSLIQKNAWLWRETNLFIEDFKKKIPENRFFSFDFSKLSTDKVMELIKFADVNISANKVVKQMQKKVNFQKGGDFPGYESWDKNQKQELSYFCKDLAEIYGYKI